MSEINRLKIKTSEQNFLSEIRKEFELAPAVSRGILEAFKAHFRSILFDSEGAVNDKIEVVAVAKDEPAGKSLDECKLVSVKLTFRTDSDLDVFKDDGVTGLRRVRLLRFAEEALEQGALLTVEDLSLLLITSKRTVRRDIKFYEEREIIVPTRGYMKDIGSSLSHKTETVELYLKGYQPTEISKRLHHSLRSMERYIQTFSRVAYLKKNGLSKQEIRYVVGISEKLVEEYLELADEHDKTALMGELIREITHNFKKKVIT